MLSLFACKKNQTLESIQAQTDFSSIDYKDLVFKMGFDTVDIVKNGDTIIVEGDILLYEHKLKADPKTFPRQATVHKNMRMDDQYLTFYISQFNSPHQQSIIEGLQTFLESNLPNGINGAKLMFSNPASPDITIIFYEESSAVCGFAEFPTVLTSTIPMAPIDFEPGKKMYLNLTKLNTMSPSQIKFLVAHELGHMFGLRHTNWRATESEYSMYDGIQIGAYTVWGTNNSSTNPDPTSVFNSHTCGFEWNGFSNDDLIAINQLFSTNIVPAEE